MIDKQEMWSALDALDDSEGFMICIKRKSLGGNKIVSRFKSHQMLKATHALLQIRRKTPHLKHTYFLSKERASL